jgi:hypothetical protein
MVLKTYAVLASLAASLAVSDFCYEWVVLDRWFTTKDKKEVSANGKNRACFIIANSGIVN